MATEELTVKIFTTFWSERLNITMDINITVDKMAIHNWRIESQCKLTEKRKMARPNE
jgi:hypothetical protein